MVGIIEYRIIFKVSEFNEAKRAEELSIIIYFIFFSLFFSFFLFAPQNRWQHNALTPPPPMLELLLVLKQ